ncbi:MAG TPA: aldo/keto reductase [Phycisphaerae bacterium]|nr:aldo/keto reductase [Phycisphaerae bacterium]HPS53111.1 aldo/keto reductase [Phycisphaerae bacterium]
MEYRNLGKTEIRVTPIIYGAWAIGGWMWGPQDESAAVDAIRTSLDAGINAIDTAAVYGFGRSERLVAKAVKGRRDKTVIMTKYGLRWDAGNVGTLRFNTTDLQGHPLKVYRYAGAKSVVEECERSLKNLDTDYIDVYQIHWPDDTTPLEETFGAIEKLMKQGKIRAAGVSNYTTELLADANSVIQLASCQPPYSMVLRNAEKDIIPWCEENQVGVVVYSPLQRGLLTGKITPDYQFAPDDHRRGNVFFTPHNIASVNAFLAKIKPIADAHNATLAQLVINWTVHRNGITAALVGARNAKQAQENAAALNFTLTSQETQTINNLLDELKIEK